MISSYLMLIILTPFLAASYVGVNSRRRRNPVVASFLWFALGAAGSLILLGGIDWLMVRRFHFLGPQIRAALRIGASPSVWKAPDYRWLANATWLVLPCIGLVVSLVLVIIWATARRRPGKTQELLQSAMLFAFILIGIEVLFIAMEVSGFWLLQYPYYAIYLTPFAFICIGVALALTDGRVSEKWNMAIIALVAGIVLVPFLLAPRFVSACGLSCKMYAAIGCVFLSVAMLAKKTWLLFPASAMLSLFNVAAAPNQGGVHLSPICNGARQSTNGV